MSQRPQPVHVDGRERSFATDGAALTDKLFVRRVLIVGAIVLALVALSLFARAIVDQVEQALDQGVRSIFLAQREKGGGVGALVGRDGASATDADGVVAALGYRHDLLEADLVAPGGVEVVLVEETFALRKRKSARRTVSGSSAKRTPPI